MLSELSYSATAAEAVEAATARRASEKRILEAGRDF
jgi:hypothetical protein